MSPASLPSRPGSLPKIDLPIPAELGIVLQSIQDGIDRLTAENQRLAAENARLSANIADLTAEVIKLTASMARQQEICTIRMGKVAEDISDLQDGKAETTQTHLRTLEAERDALKKSQGEWTKQVVFVVVSFLIGLLTWKLTH